MKWHEKVFGALMIVAITLCTLVALWVVAVFVLAQEIY